MYNIQVLNQNQWKLFKIIRLEGLKNNPNSFSHSYQNKILQSDKEWKNKFSSKRDNIIILNKQTNSVIGMSVIFYSQDNKTKHTASIGSVYINPEFRGQGLANKLIGFTLKKIKENKEIIKVKLTVIESQTAAENLYKKFGFKIIGINKKEIKINNTYLDLINYELIF